MTNENAVALGKLGSAARIRNQSAEERSAHASNAIQAYWDSLTKEERFAVMQERWKKRRKKS